ncbi:MAG: trigger factor [Alphaproteobacteria bacterium]|nr:trigger factor [Alphaproteobacteria bacterium]MCL2889927.1 trigger factor [Alphaproteobacteria bacterium]
MFKKEKIKDLHYIVSGVLTAAEIQAATDEVLVKYGEKAKIPGFRPGKVPLAVLRQKYGASAFGESVDKAINADLDAYVKDKKIRLAGAPKADMGAVEMGADIEYTLEFDILPTLPEFDLEKFTLTKKVAKVEDSEVKKSLENLRKSRATSEKQDAKYSAADGDVVVIDFKGFVKDEAFEGGEAKKHRLILGSGSFIPGFEEKIIGHKTGDKFDIKVKFPKEYHSKDLAGKDAKFEIEIHEIRKHNLPDLNDALAAEVGFKTVKELADHVKKILGEQYEDAAMREMRNELLDILADKVKLDIPETLVNQEVEMAKNELAQRDASEKFDEKKEQKDAQRRVKLGLILAEWGSANKVEVTRDDLQKAIWAEASRYPDPQQVFEFYNKNPNALSMVRGMLFEQKALDAMIAKTKTKEKSVKPDDLFKQAEPK